MGSIGRSGVHSNASLAAFRTYCGKSVVQGTQMRDVDQLLVETDAVGLGQLVAAGTVSADELAKAAVARIERLDPKLNSVVVRMFQQATVERGSLPNGPFGGVPFLLKDMNCDVAGVATSKGNAALRRFPMPHDNVLVERFRATGVSILGKTNTPEFGLQAVTEPDTFGPTRNPWNTDRTPGGSSGGSSAAVAAGLVPFAAAGDGGGSIRIPASYCGLLGLKPSRGRMPLGPDIAEAWFGASQPGVLSRSVRDTAVMLDATHGHDVGAPYGAPEVSVPYAQVIAEDPSRLRIALSTVSPIGTAVDPENRRAAEDAAALLESLGHVVEPADAPIDGKGLASAYLTMYFGDVAATLRELQARLGRRIGADDVELGTRAIGAIGNTISAGDLASAVRTWGRIGRQMGQFFESYDLYLTPTTAMPAARIGELKPSVSESRQMEIALRTRAWRAVLKTGLIDEMAERNLSRTPFTQLANIAGLPGISVPLSTHDDGMPCGVQFIGPYGREDRLLGVAAQLERAAPWFDRVSPMMTA